MPLVLQVVILAGEGAFGAFSARDLKGFVTQLSAPFGLGFLCLHRSWIVLIHRAPLASVYAQCFHQVALGLYDIHRVA